MPADRDIEALYHELLACWNRRDATGFAALFAEDGRAVGFDGSAHDGARMIAQDLSRIFEEHRTPAYVGLVREVRLLGADAAIVDAAAGMRREGEADIDPSLNAIQSLVAQRRVDGWRIVLFQNTPAAYHGRPQLAERLTEDLRSAMQRANGRWLIGPSRSNGG